MLVPLRLGFIPFSIRIQASHFGSLGIYDTSHRNCSRHIHVRSVHIAFPIYTPWVVGCDEDDTEVIIQAFCQAVAGLVG